MKIRTGFVSNSSSSSFLVFGAWVPSGGDEMEEKVRKMVEKGEIHKEIKFVYGNPDGETGGYVGRSWASVDDDETGKQFKQTVIDACKKLEIEDKPDTAEDSWYNG